MAAKRWLAAEPDADIREELQALLDGDPAALAERFAGRLMFGTAGLRAAVGAGPLRMNRLVIRQAAAGLANYLMASDPRAAERGVVIGYDVRRKSDLFAQDTAQVMAAAGIRAMLLPGSAADAGAGVVDHRARRRRRGDGDRVAQPAGRQRLQGVPRRRRPDRAAPRRRHRRGDRRVDVTAVTLAEPDDPLITMLDDGVTAAYLASIAGVRLRPDVAGIRVAYTPMHGVGGDTACTAFELAGFDRPAVVDEQFDPDGSFPTVSFPNPEEPGAMDLLLALADESGAAAGDRQRSRCRPLGRGDPAARWLVAATRRRRDRMAARRPHPRQHVRRRPLGDHDARVVVAARRPRQELRRAREGDVHGVQVDRQDDPRQPGPALRARLRTGARLPRRASVRSTRTASRRR